MFPFRASLSLFEHSYNVPITFSYIYTLYLQVKQEVIINIHDNNNKKDKNMRILKDNKYKTGH